MTDSQLQEIKDRQRRWMREREIDMEKEQIGGGSNLSPAQLVNTLTEKIAARMQTAMKPQERLEQSVADEKDTNMCSICFELMLPKDRSPTLLFPCGHTFCKTCLASNEKKTGKKLCPWCRSKIESQAINISLQNVIVAYAKNKGLYRESQDPEPAVQQRPAPAPELPYTQQLELITLRCSILQEEIHSAELTQREIDDRVQSQQQLIEFLKQEESATLDKLRKVEQELGLIHAHMSRSQSELNTLADQKEEVAMSVRLIHDTLAPLLREKDKLQTLARLNSG